jgi:hypothetical protein
MNTEILDVGEGQCPLPFMGDYIGSPLQPISAIIS